MRKLFIKIPDLKKRAKKDIEKHLLNWDRKKKVLNSIIGVAATNKEWLIDAQKKYSIGLSKKNIDKINYFLSALFDIYKCYFLMEHSRFTDEKIISLKDKYETSYLNTVLEFIEENIHNEQEIALNFNYIKQAINVLSSENSQLAKGYYSILEKHISLNQSQEGILKILLIPDEDFSAYHALRLKGMFLNSENVLKKNPTKKKILLQKLEEKLNAIFNYFDKKINSKLHESLISIKEICILFKNLEGIYQPLHEISYSKRILGLLKKKDDFEIYNQFIDIDFPEMKKLYEYLAYQRNTIDVKKIFEVHQKIEKFNKFKKDSFWEIKELEIQIKKFSQRFDSVLSDYYKRDLLSYYKIYNNIINAKENDLKTQEMMRFEKYLNNQIKDKSHSEFLTEKLIVMRDEIRDELYQGAEFKLKKKLSNAKNESEIKVAFDEIIQKFIEFEDISGIEEAQKNKHLILQKIRKIDSFLKFLDKLDKKFNTHQKASIEISYQEIQNIQKKKSKYSIPLLMKLENDLFLKIQEFIPIDGFDEEEILPKEFHHNSRLIILDKYSLRNYIIFTQKNIVIGRNEDSDIILRCKWISGKHIVLDFDKKSLIDYDSTNGTFCNNNQKPCTTFPLNTLYCFDLSHAFLFDFLKIVGGYHLKMTEILDDSLQKIPDKQNYIVSLKKTEFLFLDDLGQISINKISGNINESSYNPEDILTIKYSKGQFILTDFSEELIDINILSLKENATERFSFTID